MNDERFAFMIALEGDGPAQLWTCIMTDPSAEAIREWATREFEDVHWQGRWAGTARIRDELTPDP